jgi:hypothetical protein
MTIARSAIASRVLEETGLGRDLTAATNATATNVVCDSLKAPTVAERLIPNGSLVYVYYDTGGVAPQGEEKYTSTFDPSTGILTVSAAFTAAVTAGDKFFLARPEVGAYTQLTDAIKRALTQRCSRWLWRPLTRLPDGDMESSGVTSWSNSNGTLSKIATAFSFPDLFMNQVLSIVTSAAGGYAYQAIATSALEKQGWNLVVLARNVSNTTGTLDISAYDVTGAAVITLSGDETSIGHGAWAMNRYTFSLPSGCESFQVRFGHSANTATVYIAAVWLWRDADRELPIPTRVPSPGYVGRVVELLDRGQGTYEGWGQTERREITSVHHRTDSILGGVTLEFDDSLSGGPYMYQECSNYPNLTTDASEVQCAEAIHDYIVAASGFEFLDSLHSHEGVRPHSPGQVNPYEAERTKWENRYKARDKKLGAKTQIIIEKPSGVRP